MRKSTITLLIILLTATVAMAVQKDNGDKKQWLKEMREYKHSFLAKDLELSRDQQNKFFPIYDKMDDELMKVNGETRDLEQKVADSDKPSDLEYDMAIQAIFDLKGKEAEIEGRYLDQFREILTKRQLFQLKNSERKFSMQMMRKHHQIKEKNKKQ
jgi:Spy/CpxP family protein refolding chaperone